MHHKLKVDTSTPLDMTLYLRASTSKPNIRDKPFKMKVCGDETLFKTNNKVLDYFYGPIGRIETVIDTRTFFTSSDALCPLDTTELINNDSPTFSPYKGTDVKIIAAGS
jgi:hypothetical protein